MQIVSNGDNLHGMSNPVQYFFFRKQDLSFQKTRLETISMKCPILFSGKNKKQ